MEYREDGINSGYRNIGRFFLSMIPLALGTAALSWLAVWTGLHAYWMLTAQQDRRSVYVGAAIKPKEKIKIAAENNCMKVLRVDLDGDSLTIYGQNGCGKILDTEWRWEALSPDGTVLHQGYQNGAYCPSLERSGEKGECVQSVEIDDRTDTMRVWLDHQ